MEPDIAKVLTYEIKKELADRYFGFRKLIEEDKLDLDRKLRHYSITIEQKIGIDLSRIYILLGDEELIRQFLEMTGLEERFFYDPYILSSPTIRKRVFEGIKARGFTPARRFKNLILDGYESLYGHVGQYREKFSEMLENEEIIKEEIKLFYQKNDLGDIMGFLRGLDTAPGFGSGLDGGPGIVSPGHFEKKMQVEPPRSIEQVLPVIPPIMPPAKIRRKLKRLAKEAFTFQNISKSAAP
jgi:hypothetical protein